MPKFESPLGNKQISGQPMKDFSVPDETQYQPPPQMQRDNRYAPPVIDQAAFQEFQARMQQPLPQSREMSQIEQEIFAAKKAKREGKERLSDGAKRRIEMLIGMTRQVREVEIDGQKYQLKSLADHELREAITSASEFDGSVQFIFETRKQLLARSLTIVAGVEIDQFLGSNDLESKFFFIEQIDHALLLRLYNEYLILAKDVQDKYALKTEEQVKEVLADLKKP